MRKLTICAILVAATSAARAADYVLQASATPQSALWSADGGETTLHTSDVPEGSTFRVLNSKSLQATEYEMPGIVELGCVDDPVYGSTTGLITRSSSGTLTVNAKWYWGRIHNTAASTSMTVDGTIDVISSKSHWFGSSANAAAILAADLRSETGDVNITLGHQYSSNSATFDDINDSCPKGLFCLVGDNSGYKGKFSVYSSQLRRVLVLGGDYPLGSPETDSVNALTVDSNSSKSLVIAMGSECRQSANRTMYFSSAKESYFGAWKGSGFDGYTLSYPISSSSGASSGKFIKVGDGTFRYNGAYTAKEIAVSNGTFVVGADATFPAGQKFIVGTGAKLVIEQAAAQNLTNPNITFVDETATAEYGVETIPFEGGVSTPVELTAAKRAYGWVHPFKLANPIALPVPVRKRIPVYTIPNGEMTLEDFRDETSKTEDDLPVTSLELEKDPESGTQTLYIVVEPIMTKVTVDFDGTNATPYAVAEDWPAGLVQPFALSQPFALPILATNRVAVMTIPGGTHTLEDFRDETPKTAYELPTTWLELENDGEGNQVLYVVARPALANAGGARWAQASYEGKPTWSDELLLHAGADYYYFSDYGCVTATPRTTGGSNSDSTYNFKGESFTLADGKTVYDFNTTANFEDLRTYSGGRLRGAPASNTSKRLARYVTGNWFVGGDVDSWSTPSIFYCGAHVTTIGLLADLSGSGALNIYSENNQYLATDKPGTLLLSGDNSAFAGQLRFTETTDSRAFFRIQFADANAFGGPLEEFAANAVLIDKESNSVTGRVYRMVIAPQASVTIDTANRGWQASTAFGIHTTTNVVFGFAPPRLTISEEVRKDGPGALLLGCGEMSVGGSAFLTVAEGSVGESRAGCAAELPVVFAGGGVCVDCAAPAEVQSAGFAPKSIELAEGVTSLTVAFLNLPSPETGPAEFSRTVLTAPEGSPALTFAPERCRGYEVTVTAAPGDGGATVYTANFTRSGLLIFYR